jgi:hypothetical protein
MDYLGLIGGSDLYEYGEGAHYLFLLDGRSSGASCGWKVVNRKTTANYGGGVYARNW